MSTETKTQNIISFPLPKAAESEITRIDLNEYVNQKENGIIYAHVEGDSMIEENIYDGDLLVVDRFIEPKSGDVIVARLGDGYTVKKFERRAGKFYLVPANGAYEVRQVSDSDDFEIFGVVIHTIHRLESAKR